MTHLQILAQIPEVPLSWARFLRHASAEGPGRSVPPARLQWWYQEGVGGWDLRQPQEQSQRFSPPRVSRCTQRALSPPGGSDRPGPLVPLQCPVTPGTVPDSGRRRSAAFPRPRHPTGLTRGFRDFHRMEPGEREPRAGDVVSLPRRRAGPPPSVSLMVSKPVGLLRRIGGQRHLGANVQSCRFTKRRVQVIFILLINSDRPLLRARHLQVLQ